METQKFLEECELGYQQFLEEQEHAHQYCMQKPEKCSSCDKLHYLIESRCYLCRKKNIFKCICCKGQFTKTTSGISTKGINVLKNPLSQSYDISNISNIDNICDNCYLHDLPCDCVTNNKNNIINNGNDGNDGNEDQEYYESKCSVCGRSHTRCNCDFFTETDLYEDETNDELCDDCGFKYCCCHYRYKRH